MNRKGYSGSVLYVPIRMLTAATKIYQFARGAGVIIRKKVNSCLRRGSGRQACFGGVVKIII